jgi:hypothetical protein
LKAGCATAHPDFLKNQRKKYIYIYIFKILPGYMESKLISEDVGGEPGCTMNKWKCGTKRLP